MVKARKKNAGEVRIDLCAWCLRVAVRSLGFWNSLLRCKSSRSEAAIPLLHKK